MENKPHGRDKKLGSGSAGVEKGRRVDIGGPVGGESRRGRPGGQSGRPADGMNRASGGQRGGSGLGALGLLAIFALIPKKYRGLVLIAVLVILLLSVFSGGANNSAAPVYPAATAPVLGGIDDSGSLFGGGGLFGSDDLFGAGSSYSGGTPSGGSTGSGGLLQGLPGTGTPTPALTATPQPSAPVQAARPDPAVAAAARAKRVTPRGGGQDTVTVMVYMCGTDLESRYGMATSDLSEMVKAELSDKINVIVMTGGCKAWKNNIMSNSVNQIYRVRSGGLERLEEDFGSAAMTDPANLTKFIRYCASGYPADRNFLILWDHGGGSISGYGYDEKSGTRASMTLPQIDRALDSADVVFDWIGYDACLMSTLETALVSGSYADYLIASEEVEPGTGWYYTGWLNALSENSSLPTLELSKILVDDYVRACRARSYSAQVTLSVTDLAELESTVPALFRDFAVSTNDLISSDDYRQVSNARAGARQFAQSTRINQVDLADLALRIDTEQSRALAEAIQSCVKYNGTTISRCYGLSIYFPYESLNSVSSAINTSDSLGLDEEYAKVIKSFASLEYGGQVSSSASQGSYGGSGGWESLFGGSSGGYGELLEALLGSSYGSGSYGGSPSGALSGSYANAYGQSAAGYSLSSDDLMGLLSAFSGRSMPAGLDWVDTGLIADSAGRIAASSLDPGRIAVSMRNGRPVLELTDEEWALVQTVELNLFADDGKGYIDLGLDNSFAFDGNCLLLDFDGSWLTLDGQVCAYYLVSDTQNADGSWTTVGRIPALLNGEPVNLQVIFDDENPYGGVTGAYPLYTGGETETAPKGLVPLRSGDRLDFLCDYYGYDGSYASSHTLGNSMIVRGEPVLENLMLNAEDLLPSYRITDLYGNHYWLSF